MSAVAQNIHICTGNLCCTTACPRHFLKLRFLERHKLRTSVTSRLAGNSLCIPPIPLQDCGRKTEFQFDNCFQRGPQCYYLVSSISVEGCFDLPYTVLAVCFASFSHRHTRCGAEIDTCRRADSFNQATIRNRVSPENLFWKPRCQIWIVVHTNCCGRWKFEYGQGCGCFGYPVQLLHPSRSLEPLPHVDWGNLEVRKNKFPRAGTCSRHVPTTMQVPPQLSPSRRTAMASSRAGEPQSSVSFSCPDIFVLARTPLSQRLSLKNAPPKMLGHSLVIFSPAERAERGGYVYGSVMLHASVAR